MPISTRWQLDTVNDEGQHSDTRHYYHANERRPCDFKNKVCIVWWVVTPNRRIAHNELFYCQGWHWNLVTLHCLEIACTAYSVQSTVCTAYSAITYSRSLVQFGGGDVCSMHRRRSTLSYATLYELTEAKAKPKLSSCASGTVLLSLTT